MSLMNFSSEESCQLRAACLTAALKVESDLTAAVMKAEGLVAWVMSGAKQPTLHRCTIADSGLIVTRESSSQDLYQ